MGWFWRRWLAPLCLVGKWYGKETENIHWINEWWFELWNMVLVYTCTHRKHKHTEMLGLRLVPLESLSLFFEDYYRTWWDSHIFSHQRILDKGLRPAPIKLYNTRNLIACKQRIYIYMAVQFGKLTRIITCMYELLICFFFSFFENMCKRIDSNYSSSEFQIWCW